MVGQPIASLLSLAIPLSATLDLMDPKIVNHHRRVAMIAYLLGLELDLPLRQRRDLLLAGLFHDIGAFSLQERLDSLAFEIANPHGHAEIGFQLLREFAPFAIPAEIVRFHHVPWDNGAGAWFNGFPVPVASHVLHLADRIAVLVPEQTHVLEESPQIIQAIRRHAGKKFRPDLVAAFNKLADRECFWLDAAAAVPTEPLWPLVKMDPVQLDAEVMQGFTGIFSRIIDFRSPFTATHSSGVAAVAGMLAELAGFSGDELRLIQMAGHLHDLGKLAVPTAILEKPGKLTPKEWQAIRAHTYYGFRILEKIPSLATINVWGSLHHERLDGSGYPFHLNGDNLPLGTRIMAIADVFTALTEDRPYRRGLEPDTAVEMIMAQSKEGILDSHITQLLQANLRKINTCRTVMAGQIDAEYRRFMHRSGYGGSGLADAGL